MTTRAYHLGNILLAFPMALMGKDWPIQGSHWDIISCI
jgi:hypothetical protein